MSRCIQPWPPLSAHAGSHGSQKPSNGVVLPPALSRGGQVPVSAGQAPPRPRDNRTYGSGGGLRPHSGGHSVQAARCRDVLRAYDGNNSGSPSPRRRLGSASGMAQGHAHNPVFDTGFGPPHAAIRRPQTLFPEPADVVVLIFSGSGVIRGPYTVSQVRAQASIADLWTSAIETRRPVSGGSRPEECGLLLVKDLGEAENGTYLGRSGGRASMDWR